MRWQRSVFTWRNGVRAGEMDDTSLITLDALNDKGGFFKNVVFFDEAAREPTGLESRGGWHDRGREGQGALGF